MPLIMWAVPVPALVRFAIVFPLIVFGMVTPMNIPTTCWPPAGAPVVVVLMLFAVEVLPSRLFVIVGAPSMICIALMLGLRVAEPIAVIDPMMLLAIGTVPVPVP